MVKTKDVQAIVDAHPEGIRSAEVAELLSRLDPSVDGINSKLSKLYFYGHIDRRRVGNGYLWLPKEKQS